MIDLGQLKADREAGTPGEWRSERDTCHFDTLSDIYAGKALIAQTGATPVQAQEADARRIARLPELEAAYIEVATKLDKAVEALQEMLSRRQHPIGFYWRNGAQFTSEYGNEYEGTSDVISSCKEDVGYLEAVIALITAKSERDE